jgi:hypothetical protein
MANKMQAPAVSAVLALLFLVAVSSAAASASPPSASVTKKTSFGEFTGTVRLDGLLTKGHRGGKRVVTVPVIIKGGVKRNGKTRQVFKRVTATVRSLSGLKKTQKGRRLLADCGILSLVLGPLDLDLLGLNVNLNKVVLDIVATPGAGELLGNLLCAVANLLNPGGLLGSLNGGLLSNVLGLVNAILLGLFGNVLGGGLGGGLLDGLL